MEKLRAVYKYISGINFAYILILGLLGKALISDVSYATFLLTIPVLGFEAYKLYIKTKTPDPIVHDRAIMDELDKLKAKVNATSMEKNLATAPKRYF